MSFLVPSATYGTRMGRREYVGESAFLLCIVMRRVTWWHCQIGLGIIIGSNKYFKVHQVNQTISNKLILSQLWVANLLDWNWLQNQSVSSTVFSPVTPIHHKRKPSLPCFGLLSGNHWYNWARRTNTLPTRDFRSRVSFKLNQNNFQQQQLDGIKALVKPNILYNTLGSIHPCSGVEGKSLHNNYIKE